MKLLCAILSSVCLLAAQETGKPTPTQKARELLDAAAGMVGGTGQEIQAVGLRHIGDNYQAFDKAKALEFLRQAFAAAAALPEDRIHNGQREQAEIIGLAAGLDLAAAEEMLRQIPPSGSKDYDPRWPAIMKVVAGLVERKDFDRAIELVEGIGSTGFYCFSAAGSIFEALPKDDPRRTTLFGSAMVAYGAHPHDSFRHMLTACWRDVPKQMAASALDSILKRILDKKDDGEYGALAFASAKGTVSFSSREDGELFDLMHLVREINPKRADEILSTRPELRQWLEMYPRGTESMQAEGMFWSFMTGGDNKADVERAHKEQEVRVFAEGQAAKAVNAAKEDVDKAIELAQSIPMPSRRAEVFGNIARAAAAKDRTKARGAVTKCTAALKEVKNPADRIAAWDALAEAAHEIGDDELALRTIDKALEDAAELSKEDEKAEVPNVILREYWPSTQAYRRVVMRATKILAVDAEPMLQKIADKDVNLLARIEMAQALLGRPHERWPTFPPRKRKN